ncbi:tripartite tricarboxylate transporter substrate binding protein [Reyranella sp. CPCC 100927]|uniref:tripartite tricarboxylate transporter substrate binding protein n=1 Tax=Reyranella sp. CPCC 100927 TaxID=2599616 RepID=UPI0011B639AB|nr:tripartite tricarboxylate transporter substrate binding protein [Reyranella sp. CPCC 100927]TWT15403.1 tripartite tricarboxylate transporter substrate binding protein [Reyranella sp. CPCC 100927]
MNRWIRLACLAVLAGVLATPAVAQGYPTRPIRIVHGFTAGGPVDAIARLIAAGLSERLGQQAFVEGKPGAGGTLGAQAVARSDPDGYTLFLMASGHATSPGLYKSLPYDAVDDFTMISMVASSPFAIMTLPKPPYASLQDLVQRARAEPGKIDFATGGVGSGMHLVALLLQSRAGIQMNHVPYKGGNTPMLALLSGEVPVLFSSVAGMVPQVESGKIRMLAVTSRARYRQVPDVPTVAETLLPEFDALAWYALAAPRNLPAPLLARLSETTQAILQRPDVVDKIRAQGAEVWSTAPGAAQAFLGSEVARWTKVIRDEKITAPE